MYTNTTLGSLYYNVLTSVQVTSIQITHKSRHFTRTANISDNSVYIARPFFHSLTSTRKTTSRHLHIIQCKPVRSHHHNHLDQHHHNLRINTSSKAAHLTLIRTNRDTHESLQTSLCTSNNPDYHEYREPRQLINTLDA
jgi:hypothetical protein